MANRLRNIADAYKWSLETAQALRAGKFAEVDMEELIDEVESIAGGLRRELVSTLKDVIEALLVLDYTKGDKEEADRQLAHAQGQLRLLLHASPSLEEAVGDAVVKAYDRARDYVREDYGLSLPDQCPFTLERITEDPYVRMVTQGQLP
jgi:Domain of unknown function DUF29